MFAMKNIVNSTFVLALALSLTACQGGSPFADGTPEYGSAEASLVEGTPVAVGVLNFLNDASTTFEVLDHEVGLDRRAAWNISLYRDGADGLAGTSDDDLFDSVIELDAVYWVGPAGIARLEAYAIAYGWVPMGGDHLGVWEGLTFTVLDAENTLILANEAPRDLLDELLRMDRRAVDSIIAARPIASVAVLSELYWVGPVHLARLLQYAQKSEAPAKDQQ
jgi:hypothetical protein